jgi:hypothetical protein
MKPRITGTMLPILVLGEHYGRTPADLFDDYDLETGTFHREIPDNGDMQRGRTLEEMVIRIVCEREGYTVLSLQAAPEIDCGRWVATGHIDAVIINGEGQLVNLEAKCPRVRKSATIRDNGCLPEHTIQAGFYSRLNGAHHAEVIIWDCDAWDYAKFVVPRSDDLEDLMFHRAARFVDAVLDDVRPGSDGQNHFADAGQLVPVIGQRTVEATGEHAQLLCRLESIMGHKRVIDEELEQTKAALMSIWPADCKSLKSTFATVSLSPGRVSNTLDQRRIKADHPEIDFSVYTKSVQGAPFLSYRAAKKDDE